MFFASRTHRRFRELSETSNLYNSMKMKVALLLVAALAGAAAVAQTPKLPYLTAKQESAYLLVRKSVQKELNATPDQVGKWESVFKNEAAAEDELISKAGGAELSPALKSAVQKMTVAAVDSALGFANDAQLSRLRQIALQQLGVEAFIKPDVAAELAFTPDQKAAIGAVVGELQKKVDDFSADLGQKLENIPLPAEGDAASQKEYQAAVGKIIEGSRAAAADLDSLKADTTTKALAMLTDAQRTKWKIMQGTEFKLRD